MIAEPAVIQRRSVTFYRFFSLILDQRDASMTARLDAQSFIADSSGRETTVGILAS